MKENIKIEKSSSGLDYRYFDNTKDNTLLLLHGFLGDQHIWDLMLRAFSKHFNIVTIDLPGHGNSACDTSTLQMSSIAERVISLMDVLGISSFHLVGHSMGGYVGLEILQQKATCLSSLTLLNSTAKADSQQKKEDRLRAVKVFDLSPRVYIKEAINNLFYAPNIKHLADDVERLQQIALGTSVEGAQACLRGMRDRADFEKLVNNSETPILYLAGVHDSTVTYESIIDQIKSEAVQLIPLEKSGHMSFAEEQKACEDAILNFILNI